jgi:phage tail-like protein
VSADVYKNHRFRLRWDDHYVAGFRRLAAPSRTAEVVKIRTGNDPTVRKAPGTADYDPIAMEHGITVDADFEAWADAAWSGAAGLGALRRDLSIDVFDEHDEPIASYEVRRAWVSQFQALAQLDGEANGLAIQHLRIENEGWLRSVTP